MDWMELTVRTTTAASELVSQILIDAGSTGTMIEDKFDVRANQRPEGRWDIIGEEIAGRMEDDVKVTGYYPVDEKLGDSVRMVEGELRRIKGMDLGFDAGKLTLSTGELAGEDWAQSWKKAFKPFRLGRHMVIKPGWTEYAPQADDHIIEIDPGMAFGTGTHETTGMCVEFVEEYVKPGMRVIDVGTGTGILAIAAAHMGASDVLAIDIDATAVRVAEENVCINGFAGTIHTAVGDLLENVDEQADVVIANIIADVILMLAAPVRAHIKPGGQLICSGIAVERRDEVLKALADAGYAAPQVCERGGWCAMTARRDR